MLVRGLKKVTKESMRVRENKKKKREKGRESVPAKRQN